MVQTYQIQIESHPERPTVYIAYTPCPSENIGSVSALFCDALRSGALASFPSQSRNPDPVACEEMKIGRFLADLPRKSLLEKGAQF